MVPSYQSFSVVSLVSRFALSSHEFLNTVWVCSFTSSITIAANAGFTETQDGKPYIVDVKAGIAFQTKGPSATPLPCSRRPPR